MENPNTNEHMQRVHRTHWRWSLMFPDNTSWLSLCLKIVWNLFLKSVFFSFSFGPCSSLLPSGFDTCLMWPMRVMILTCQEILNNVPTFFNFFAISKKDYFQYSHTFLIFPREGIISLRSNDLDMCFSPVAMFSLWFVLAIRMVDQELARCSSLVWMSCQGATCK